ncbi:MAG: hypothetical protein NE330_16725, partial [Lentisphaeraceae bacterium]|nr:hypothetical protein [Lentisphaeraceae bacterium]
MEKNGVEETRLSLINPEKATTAAIHEASSGPISKKYLELKKIFDLSVDEKVRYKELKSKNDLTDSEKEELKILEGVEDEKRPDISGEFKDSSRGFHSGIDVQDKLSTMPFVGGFFSEVNLFKKSVGSSFKEYNENNKNNKISIANLNDPFHSKSGAFKHVNSLKVSRNGVMSGPFLGLANNIYTTINTFNRVSEIWDKISSLTPSLGWSFQCKTAFLKGPISIRWGWKEADDNYKVFKWWALSLNNFTVAALDFQFEYGAKINFVFVRFELIAYIKASLDLNVTASIEAVPHKDPETNIEIADGTGKVNEVKRHKYFKVGADADTEIGINLILLRPDWCNVNGNISVGFRAELEIKLNETVPCPMVHLYRKDFKGNLSVKVKGLFDVDKEYVFIKGTSERSPWKTFTLEKYKQNLKYLEYEINAVWERINNCSCDLNRLIDTWHATQLYVIRTQEAEQLPEMRRKKIDPTGFPITYPFQEYPEDTSEWNFQWSVCRKASEQKKDKFFSAIEACEERVNEIKNLQTKVRKVELSLMDLYKELRVKEDNPSSYADIDSFAAYVMDKLKSIKTSQDYSGFLQKTNRLSNKFSSECSRLTKKVKDRKYW